MTTRTAYVIMCNDYPEAVCMGTEEEADTLAKRLKDEDVAKFRKHLGPKATPPFKHWAARVVPVWPPA
jgi:hypothetical protein